MIIATINILKDAGLVGGDEKLDIDSLTKEMDADPNAASAFSEIQQEDEASSSGETDQTAPPTTKGATKSTTAGGGIMEFIKKNPVPVAVGGGLLALGIYQMMKPKAKAANLSGVRTTAAKKTKALTTAKAKASTSRKVKVKTVSLF